VTALAFALRLVGFAMFLPAILFLIPAIAPFVEGAQKYPLVKGAIGVTQPVTLVVQQQVPTKIRGYDTTPAMVILLALALRFGCRRYARKLDERVETRTRQRSLKQFLASRSARPTPSKLDTPAAAREDREAILRQFIEAKKKLEEVEGPRGQDSTSGSGDPSPR